VPERLARLASKEGTLAICAVAIAAWGVHRFDYLPVWVPLEAFAIVMLAVAYLAYNFVRHRAPHTGTYILDSPCPHPVDL
jgi:membrane protein implicated in regulation of membrane protease activity